MLMFHDWENPELMYASPFDALERRLDAKRIWYKNKGRTFEVYYKSGYYRGREERLYVLSMWDNYFRHVLDCSEDMEKKIITFSIRHRDYD